MHEAVIDTFRADFKGDANKTFDAYLKKSDALRPDNREVLILQSSGCGKSKLITQCLRENAGILFNTRDPYGT